MRIAILHDDFSLCGGGEKLISILARGLTERRIETDIFTFDITEETKKIIPQGLRIKTIKDKRFSSRDYKTKRYLFSKLNLGNDYDLFIFSGHISLFAAKKNKPNILYCHNIQKPETLTSIQKGEPKDPDKHGIQKGLVLMKNSRIEKTWARLYDIKNKFIKKPIPGKISTKIDAVRFLIANSFDLDLLKSMHMRQGTEKEEIKHVQKIIVNSANIQNKVKKYHKRDTIVIHPPIETKKFHYRKNKDFWLSVNRITPAKRIELQLKAFAKMPDEKLYVMGDTQDPEYYRRLQRTKPDNVEFLGVLGEEDLIEKLSECKGMLFTVEDEDFGMAPVEAMASGKPVIAPNEGGCKETIINGKTGILINDIDEDKIVRAMKQINKNPERYKNACLKRAKRFDAAIFIEKMHDEIEKTANGKQMRCSKIDA